MNQLTTTAHATIAAVDAAFTTGLIRYAAEAQRFAAYRSYLRLALAGDDCGRPFAGAAEQAATVKKWVVELWVCLTGMRLTYDGHGSAAYREADRQLSAARLLPAA